MINLEKLYNFDLTRVAETELLATKFYRIISIETQIRTAIPKFPKVAEDT